MKVFLFVGVLKTLYSWANLSILGPQWMAGLLISWLWKFVPACWPSFKSIGKFPVPHIHKSETQLALSFILIGHSYRILLLFLRTALQMRKIGAGIYIPLLVTIWGLVTCLQGLVTRWVSHLSLKSSAIFSGHIFNLRSTFLFLGASYKGLLVSRSVSDILMLKHEICLGNVLHDKWREIKIDAYFRLIALHFL
jgi:hypothetical protein